MIKALMYPAISLLYWPVWIPLAAHGHHIAGIILGSSIVIAAWMAAWHHEFGTWKIWE